MLGQTPSVAGRFEALDALRGVCAMLVVLFHIPIYHALKDVSAFANLQFCVDVFFALSGFVLCHAYGQRLHDRAEGLRFTVMRFARLWPLHIAVLALFVLLELAKLVFSRADGSMALDSQPFSDGHTIWQIVTNTLFLQSFGLHSGLTWNGVAWSAAVEFYISILFAAVVLLFPRRRYHVFLGLCLAGGTLLYTLSPHTLFVSTDWGMLRAIFSFFAGCLVYDLRVRSGGRLTAPSLWEACCVVLAIAYAATARPGATQYAFPLLAMIVIYVFSFDQGAVSKVLRMPALQKLGLWSYSIYMVHVFVFQVMKMAASFIGHKTHLDLVGWHNDDKLMLLGTPQQAVLPALILSVVVVVPVAALTYRLIEKPAMDAARQGLSIGFGPALRSQAQSLVLSTRTVIGRGASAIAARSAAGIRNGLSLFAARRG
jgi:peptidoglycan/LPS O-acetylase OafA/YrhL